MSTEQVDYDYYGKFVEPARYKLDYDVVRKFHPYRMPAIAAGPPIHFHVTFSEDLSTTTIEYCFDSNVKSITIPKIKEYLSVLKAAPQHKLTYFLFKTLDILLNLQKPLKHYEFEFMVGIKLTWKSLHCVSTQYRIVNEKQILEWAFDS